MDTIKQSELPEIGAPLGGGFFAGIFTMNGETYASIVAPKAEGAQTDVALNESTDNVDGAMSFVDGVANTKAFADAGSEIAQWAQGLRIGGFDDWHIPALDVAEIAYRNLKPTEDSNSGFLRSGINLHAIPPTAPYSEQPAIQTSAPAFREDGDEAFETDDYYWTSTQYAGGSGCAWFVGFEDGDQDYTWKSSAGHVRAFRRLLVIQ